MASKKKPEAKASAVDVALTAAELELLRDVFGLVMPVTDAKTNEIVEGGVCEVLAGATGRGKVEADLWAKIVRACEAVSVPLGDAAPTYACSAVTVPGMYVYRVEE